MQGGEEGVQKLKIELRVKNVSKGNRCRLQRNREGSTASFGKVERQVEQGIARLGGQALAERDGGKEGEGEGVEEGGCWKSPRWMTNCD